MDNSDLYKKHNDKNYEPIVCDDGSLAGFSIDGQEFGSDDAEFLLNYIQLFFKLDQDYWEGP